MHWTQKQQSQLFSVHVFQHIRFLLHDLPKPANAEASPEFFADKDKISQVIVNLLSNAHKYTPSGGAVAIRIISTADKTEIHIKDTGNGISPEDLPMIFERFYRADKSRNRLTGGAGIGLTITKSIV